VEAAYSPKRRCLLKDIAQDPLRLEFELRITNKWVNKEIALNVIYAVWNLIGLTTVLLALPEICMCNKRTYWAATYTM